MKTRSIRFSFFCCLYLLIFQSCKDIPDNKYFLNKVLANLDQIKSASYFAIVSASAPGDTVKLITYKLYP